MTPHDETARAVLESLTADYTDNTISAFSADASLIAAALREAHAQGIEEAAQMADTNCSWKSYHQLVAGIRAQATTVREAKP